MLGDAKAAGKRHSTRAHGPEFKEKHHFRKGAHKHVVAGHSHGGGDHEVKHSARRAHSKGTRPGVGVHDRQAPHKQKERIENKHVDQGMILDEWCRGKRGSYR
jgi:hypothetical protein